MIGERIRELRIQNKYTMEEFSEKINVSRQTLSKWELGETVPDIEKTIEIANIFQMSLDELVFGGSGKDNGKDGKYIFGLVKLDSECKIEIPEDAREVFSLSPGDKMLVVGDSKQGMALVKVRSFFKK